MAYSQKCSNILKIIKGANNFTDWMYSEIRPHLKNNILELGSGIGTFSEYLMNDFYNVTLTDIETKHLSRFTNVVKLDLEINDYSKILKSKYDCVVALNVLEHIKSDSGVFRNIYNILNKGGVFVVLVPAHKWLFYEHDRAVGHHRRYSKRRLIDLAHSNGFKINKIYYFNFFAIIGRYFGGKILRKNVMSEGPVNFFNKLVPVFKIIEKYILRKKIGISLIAVLIKRF